MKKQTGYWKGFVTALLLTALVAALGATAAAASTTWRTIDVEEGFALTINDARFVPRDADGRKVPVFRYNGTVYAPVRAVCEAAGMEVAYTASTNTVHLTTQDRVLSQRPDADDFLTAEEAKEIALEDAGVRASKAVFLKVKLDWDDGWAQYEVEFYSGSTEYDYDIDAVTGAILSADRELEDFDLVPDRQDKDLITAQRARNIALDRAGGSASVVKCQLDWEDGRQVYEIELRDGRMEYECDVDARTGAILQWESEYDD